MVALVLQAAGQQAPAINFQHAAIQLGQASLHEFGAGHIGAEITHAEAAFGEEVLLAVGLKLRVDEHQRHDAAHGLLLAVYRNHLRLGAFFLIFGNIDDNQADIESHLRSSQANTLGGVHGFEHVLHKSLQFIIDVLHRGTYCPEDGVSVLSNIQKHGVSNLRGCTQVHYSGGSCSESQVQTAAEIACCPLSAGVYCNPMETRPSRKECWLVYLLGTLFAYVVMRYGFNSPSESMHLRATYDLNIYYLIGNGWMRGLMPYVDLSDLKGPLVFLFHGLGSVLTPGSFLGLCLLHAPLLGLGVLFAYKTARLFLPAAASFATVGLYTYFMLYYEANPAEHVWILQHVTLYFLLRWGMSAQRDFSRHELFIMGGSVALVLLMKFNLVAFWGPVCLLALSVAFRRSLLWLSVGFALVALPVICYFWWRGALLSMWQEYVELAITYGRTPWSDSALCQKHVLLFRWFTPSHLHERLNLYCLTVAGCIPCLSWPFLWCVCRLKKSVLWVLSAAFVLQVYAGYSGLYDFYHYAVVFYPFCFLSVLWCVCLLRRWPRLVYIAGLGTAVLILITAVSLPLYVKYGRSYNGNAQMRAATAWVVANLSKDDGDELHILEPEHFLHIYRLTGTLPGIRHFVRPMVPGGRALYSAEQSAYIQQKRPKYLLGATWSQDWSDSLVASTQVPYRKVSHGELGLPAYPLHAMRPEIVLYIRED